jgi:hypothetical protein
MEAFDSKTVSRIVGVSLRQIQYWDETGFIRPSVKLAEGRGTKRLYSFSDLIQLKVVKDLSKHGLNLKKIRRCVAPLRRFVSEKSRPLHSLRYVTDGDRVFLLTDDPKKMLEAMDRDFVLSLRIGPLVRKVDGEVRRVKGLLPRPKRIPNELKRAAGKGIPAA